MFHPVKESVSDAMRFALHAMLATCLALIRPDLQVLFFVLLLPTWGRDGDIRLLKILSGVLTFLRVNRFFRLASMRIRPRPDIGTAGVEKRRRLAAARSACTSGAAGMAARQCSDLGDPAGRQALFHV
ncbi:MAG: hypothetical protein KDC10_14035 [Calditrichaeota bacterium]|nr:hypothetical protein [Calditrichota bacterium]